ncbi:phage tail spike protein [Weissella confusa]|uniref:phage tail spike protein n=1 Tax=Weissella confusa TaxID=1583 RepID=UPI002A75273B|nr:phage tail spike protein [Weissella confusa]MDY2511593.1 phage tail spike protein [Weissella confusa]
MTPILYSSDEIDFLNNGLGQLVDLYDVDIHEQRNGLLNLTAYYPVNGQHYADISEGNIILAKPSPLDDNHAFRIVSVALDITGYAVMIEADSITYDLTNNLSKTIHMLGDGQAAMTAIQNSTLHPNIFTFYSDITHTSESQLRYVNPMAAIAGTQGSFLQIWGGELKRENRRVAMFNRRGRDNVATFRLGKNVAGLKYTVDVSNLTTEIVPTVTVNSTDASRTIEGATVQSSRMGNYPLVYSKMVDVSQDVKVDEGDTDDQIKTKINAFAANWFVKSANTGKDLPEVTVEVEVESLQDSADYADKFAKLETIGLTDTVTVYVPEFGVNVTAIVNELHYDPVAERVTKLSIGTAKASWADSNKNALNDLQDKVTKVQEQATQAVVSADGKSSNYSGRNEPAHPQEGDTWFWDDGADSGIRVFTNGKWVDSVDTKTQERITNAVDSAIDTSKKYADDLNAKQAQTTNALNEKVDKSVKELTDSQQAISSQATAYTNSAVADANAKAVQIGQTTAQNTQKALDEAKKDFTSSFASQASQTASMASDVTSKASQYASQAKSEAVAVATSADGVVRTEFKSTTDSMTATIQQNKSDADGKITKAQTTATQALDGLSTKVSQTEYNTKTGQLQTDLAATTQTANQAKTDIVSIKQKNGEQDERMNSIVSDANGTKQTISNLQTVQGKQSGDIATLQSRADGFEATVTKVNKLAVGGRNYVINSSGLNGSSVIRPTLIGTSSGANATITYPSDGILMTNGATNTTTEWYYQVATAWANFSDTPLTPGKQITFSADVMGTVPQAILRYGFNGGTGGKEDYKSFDINNTSWKRVSITVTSDSTNTGLYFRIQGGVNNQFKNGWTGGETLKFRYVKIEEGSVATDWTPAPEDVDSAVAKAQLTADNATLAINNYKTDADGRISKAQADIKLNADTISTKVAKTDYDKKTGELTTSVNKAQQTADTATQTIGTYKETNDKRVASAETNIKANSDAIKLTASKTDLDKATGKLIGDISSLEQRADGFDATVTKVNNLAVGGRNYLLNSSGLNASNTARPSVKPSVTTSAFANSTLSYSNDATTLTYTGTASQEWYYALAESYKTFESANLDKTKQYTLSVDVKGTVPSAAFRVNNFYSASVSINNSTWTRLKYTFKFPDLGGTNADKFYIRLNAISGSSTGNFVKGQTLSFRNFKLEEGNVSTDWTPAPEDIESDIAQVKLTADGLYETVNNPSKGIATRLLTAEGTITTVQDATNRVTSKQIETANGLTREIDDRKAGDNNTLQAGKDFTTSQIKSYDNGMQSQISQTSNALVAQISSLNLVNNSGFEYVNDNQLQGWHKGSAWGATLTFNSGFYIHEQNPDGTISIRHDYANDASWIYSDPIPATANANFAGSIEIAEGNGWNTSSQVPFAIDVKYYDANKNAINNLRINYAGTTIGGAWPRKSFTLTTPANTKYIAFGIGWNGGSIAFKRPALYAGSTDYGYIPGAKVGTQTALQLLKDNFQLGIKDNIGNIISGINGDTSGLMLTGKHIFLDGEVTAVGKSWLDGAVIKDATIGRAQIAELSVDSSKIINLDVNKLSGNVANFIRTYWDGRYGSTSIDSEGMTVSAGLTTTVFDKDGMKLSKSGRSVGRIGVNDLYQDFSKKGLYFGLESTGDFMAWGAQNYAGNPYTTKLSWFRAGAVPSNLPGLIEGFNFEDNVAFINPVEMRGGIKLQGANDRLLVRASNLNGGSYPTFGGPSAYFVYAGSDIYLSSNGTAINLTKIAKAFGGIRTAAIPTGFNSNGTATGWYNVDMG